MRGCDISETIVVKLNRFLRAWLFPGTHRAMTALHLRKDREPESRDR
jgi:hypothetical protein